ncbi:unnamed protein product [Sympodiomycopsis kandeliae]
MLLHSAITTTRIATPPRRISLAAAARSSSHRPLSTSSRVMFALTPYRGAAGTQPPKTFSRQRQLPRLPIPPLQATFEKYIKSLEPVFLQKEALGELKGSTAQQELDKRRQWAQELLKEGGLGDRLQHRLIDVDRTTPNNWLDDRYWLVKAYHEWRVPLLINSNWWLMFRADPASPLAKLEEGGKVSADLTKDFEVAGLEGVGLGKQQWDQAQWGVRRATWLISRFIQFKQRLDNEDIMPDASRAGAFCMHQYTRLFGITRIPALPHDWNTEPPHPTKAKHVTVIARDNFYSLEVLNDDGSLKDLADIEKSLWDIVNDAQHGDGQGVGVLTSDDRDSWAKAREHLILSSKTNAASVRNIEDSLFAVSLDSSNITMPSDHPEPPHSASPVSVDAHARNTSGAARSGHNRWYDKALTLTFEPNGRAGMMGEHSPCDALIPSIVADFAAAEPCPAPGSQFPAIQRASEEKTSATTWTKLDWQLDSQTQSAIESAKSKARELVSDSDIRTLWFDEYGAEWMKKVGKLSPDAYIQMALQLAYARVTGRQTATYETASTRLYKHGRTDVIRSFSREAYEFVSAVTQEKTTSPSELYKLLSAATTAHNSQTRTSSMGGGIDRHLTGLRLVFNPEIDTEGMPSTFTDPTFAESQSWKLSTSGLSAGDRFSGTGFGCGYPDGFGINYLAGSSLLKFGIESKHSNPEHKQPTTVFAKEVVNALRILKDICEKGAPKDDAKMDKGKL